jgi:hypothetical protein
MRRPATLPGSWVAEQRVERLNNMIIDANLKTPPDQVTVNLA